MTKNISLKRRDTVYLAGPYTHEDAKVMEMRYQMQLEFAGVVMEQMGLAVYAPIVQGHQIARLLPEKYQRDREFWLERTLPFLEGCDMMFVLQMEGWEESEGLRIEMALAEQLEIPVLFYEVEDRDSYESRTGEKLENTFPEVKEWKGRTDLN